ncbi:MAG TPA: hypothetical protein VFD90_09340 [Gaiellales bacterium]|jgi:hypothetical protein|nr:hypothetical protein [Gaiellales bacterium]
MPDPIQEYLSALERRLDVHPRRRARVLAELDSHLRESAERHGVAQAITRMGSPAAVAASFSPGPIDRLWQQRDRLAALSILLAMVASLPVATDLWNTNGHGGRAFWTYAIFLAPTALVAIASTVLVLLRRPAGARLIVPLAVLVTVTALWTVLDLPPVAGAFSGYRTAVAHGYETAGCGRAFAACADDRAGELRLNYTAGAVVLMAVYAWAVTGWTPWRRRRREQRRQLA